MTETKMQLVDWLDDLCVRFIINLPKEELESVERICFQVEEAQWFYEDFIRPLDPNLPSLNLRQFCLRIFQHCPLLSGFSPYHHSTAFSEFLAYKTRVPVRGAIMLNEAMDEVVLVKGWKKNANWSFPRGKINKDEKDIDCAVREVYEETGFDIQAAGLVGTEEKSKHIEVTMREQHMRLYVFRGVPMDTYFEPRTRKEISKIQWYKLSELPTLKKSKQQHQGHGEDIGVSANKFYMVAPFLVPLKKWIAQQKKLDALAGPKTSNSASAPEVEEAFAALQSTAASAPAAEGDMNRLLTQLRQSQQSSRECDLPEVFGPVEISRSPSAQLKNILHVPAVTDHQDEAAMARARDDKANAMLSLLRAGSQKETKRPLYTYHPPQTPLDQIHGAPTMPPSPKSHSVRAQHNPMLSQPPPFPFSPAHVGRPGSMQTLPVGPSSLKQFPSGPARNMPHHNRFPSNPSSMVPPQNYQARAPYQRTGDPQFAQSLPFLNNLPPSIPPASNLPVPKLNSHSSALLDIFKNGAPDKLPPMPSFNVVQPQPKSTSAQPQQFILASLPPKSHPHPTYSAGFPDMLRARPALGTPPFNALKPDASSQSISQQQNALLNLFHTPSSAASPIDKPRTSLTPSSLPIELSAQPSPGHSRVTSELELAVLKDKKSEVSSKAPKFGQVTIQKRPGTSSGLAKPPVSATVTGPLNFPQFDKILKKPTEQPKAAAGMPIEQPKSAAGMPIEQMMPAEQNAAPIKILSRPVTGIKSNQALNVGKGRSPKATPQKRAPKSPALQNIATEPKTPPKVFQPQILRRPETQSSTTPKTPQLETVLPNDSFILDRRTSQSQEQKNALLSLFSKPATITPPPPTLVSPLSERLPVSGDDVQRSRIGSMNSLLGDGLVSGRQTPKPSPVDKKFLLGFLDGVAKAGRN